MLVQGRATAIGQVYVLQSAPHLPRQVQRVLPGHGRMRKVDGDGWVVAVLEVQQRRGGRPVAVVRARQGYMFSTAKATSVSDCMSSRPAVNRRA
jgi:hypothetical protein